ncbi:MAG: flagellar basal body P-ring formation chaperone FlgA, partial [Rhodocyclaceae bacterium]
FALEVVSAARTPRACPKPLEIDITDRGNPLRMRAVAHCPVGGWSELYTVRARVSAPVVVAAVAVPSGQPLAAGDLAIDRRELPGAMDEVFADPAALIGQASRRALRAGQLIERRSVADAVLVRRGAQISIVARNAGVIVMVAGQAEGNGRRGEVINVRNVATGKVIRARITGPNEVEPVAIATSQSPD